MTKRKPTVALPTIRQIEKYGSFEKRLSKKEVGKVIQRNPTNKERVLKRRPDAVCRVTWALARLCSHKWQLLRGEFFEIAPYGINSMSTIGTGPTPAAAWRDAAERMK